MNETHVTLTGVVATVPEVKSHNGTRLLSFRFVSTERRFDRATGSWVNGAETWATVTCWRALAVNVEQSVRVKDRIIVQGRLRTDQWTGQDGGAPQRREDHRRHPRARPRLGDVDLRAVPTTEAAAVEAAVARLEAEVADLPVVLGDEVASGGARPDRSPGLRRAPAPRRRTTRTTTSTTRTRTTRTARWRPGSTPASWSGAGAPLTAALTECRARWPGRAARRAGSAGAAQPCRRPPASAWRSASSRTPLLADPRRYHPVAGFGRAGAGARAPAPRRRRRHPARCSRRSLSACRGCSGRPRSGRRRTGRWRARR